MADEDEQVSSLPSAERASSVSDASILPLTIQPSWRISERSVEESRQMGASKSATCMLPSDLAKGPQAGAAPRCTRKGPTQRNGLHSMANLRPHCSRALTNTICHAYGFDSDAAWVLVLGTYRGRLFGPSSPQTPSECREKAMASMASRDLQETIDD